MQMQLQVLRPETWEHSFSLGIQICLYTKHSRCGYTTSNLWFLTPKAGKTSVVGCFFYKLFHGKTWPHVNQSGCKTCGHSHLVYEQSNISHSDYWPLGEVSGRCTVLPFQTWTLWIPKPIWPQGFLVRNCGPVFSLFCRETYITS